MKILKYFLFGLLFVFPNVCQAKVNKEWLDLLVSIQIDGKEEQLFGPFGEDQTYETLESIVPEDREKPRTANYISLVGWGTNKHKDFEVDHIELISERWTLTRLHHQKVWRVDNRYWKLTLTGRLLETNHDITFFTLDHRYFMDDTVYDKTATIQSKLVHLKLNKLLKFWEKNNVKEKEGQSKS